MNKRFAGIVGTITLSAAIFAAGMPQEALAESPSWKINPHAAVQWDKSKKGEKDPSFIRGSLSKAKVKGQADVKRFMKENPDVFGLKNVEARLKLVGKETDEMGITHYTFQPVIQGVPISDSKYKIHVGQDGQILAANGELHANAPDKIKQTRKLSNKQAIQIAWNHIQVNPKELKKKIQTKDGQSLEVLTENSDLAVYHENGKYALAYQVQLQFASPEPGNWRIWVNAENGAVLKAVNQIEEAVGTGTGVLGDTKSLNTYFENNNHYLIDTTKPMNGNIYTLDNYNYEFDMLPGSYITDSDNVFNEERHTAAVDAHYYAGQVYDYYNDQFGRNSYDDQGANLISTVHFGNDYNNAAWLGNQMIYGDGDGETFAPLSGALDVVAHELTHAVTDYSADLVYENQPGALNESFSDVFGYFLDPEDWLMGEDVYTPNVSGDALRSMSHPNLYNQPDHMNEYMNLPNTKEGDHGGVHYNSGIPNKAAYHTIHALGKEKSEQIYYRALTVYLTPNSDFADAKQALIQAAADLYGSAAGSAVEAAWNQVGV
ncbi:M4 family metallopeptidase [Bacillus xiapuensis]|uniref:M4 family metallopeptidase n=1 Tax=Bacillus xiapuensis TaxID=2014075 RepID=UPI000C237649|nr:M4 family metallopeptidase [Bacillus xiapuensis]